RGPHRRRHVQWFRLWRNQWNAGIQTALSTEPAVAVQPVPVAAGSDDPASVDRTAAPVSRRLPPGIDLLDLHRLDPARYPLLLESSAAGSAQGRWDILLVAHGESFQLDRDGTVRDDRGAAMDTDFLDALDAAWRANRIPHDSSRWPFRGGWALLLGYELAARIEPVLKLPDAPGVVPVAVAVRC